MRHDETLTLVWIFFPSSLQKHPSTLKNLWKTWKSVRPGNQAGKNIQVLNLDSSFLVALRSKLWCQLIHTNARLRCFHAWGLICPSWMAHWGIFAQLSKLNPQQVQNIERAASFIGFSTWLLFTIIMEIDVKQYETIISHHLHIRSPACAAWSITRCSSINNFSCASRPGVRNEDLCLVDFDFLCFSVPKVQHMKKCSTNGGFHETEYRDAYLLGISDGPWLNPGNLGSRKPCHQLVLTADAKSSWILELGERVLPNLTYIAFKPSNRHLLLSRLTSIAYRYCTIVRSIHMWYVPGKYGTNMRIYDKLW